MSVCLVDDHILRDILVGRVERPVASVLGEYETVGTTNLYVLRLALSAARARGKGLTGDLSPAERVLLADALVRVPDGIVVVPLVEIVGRIAALRTQAPLSNLGAEVVAASERLGADVCVCRRDVGPHVEAAVKMSDNRLRPVPHCSER